MYWIRKQYKFKSIIILLDNELSFLRPPGLGILPLVPREPVWPVECKVQSVRYYSDICGAEPRYTSRCGVLGRVVSATLRSPSVSPAPQRPLDRPTHLSYSWPSSFNIIMPTERKVCVVGSGNWGSAIARIVGFNAKRHPTLHETVTMYVYEEIIDGKKLTEIINETHENVKYLPGYKIPSNVIAVPDLVEAAKDADILIFVVPHQFIQRICSTLLGKIKPTACGLSLIKGFERAEGGGIELISHVIQKLLRIPVSVLMGANIAQEVAAEKFCETTIGCKDKEMAPVFQDLIQTDNFRVVVVDDVDAVEVCGALKNVVAVGAGIVDGLEMGDNTKAAIIRLGLMEMIKFIEVFYPGCKLSTFFESCGVADLITTCYGGRNRRVAEAFVKSSKTIDELEKELLNGQKLQGPITADEVNYMLKQRNMEDRFPLMTAVHKICKGEMKPIQLVDAMRSHPEHM